MIKQAFYKSIPVMAGYIVLGTGFGILMHNAGYGVLWTAAMSIFIYAGSMQYVGVNLLTGGASVITTALTTVMVNARHLFYSISMVDLYKDAGKYKPYMIFALTDETYSLLCDGKAPEGADPNAYRFFVSLFNHSYWVTGSILGSLLGAVIPFSTAGIEFSMTALFIAAFTEQWLTTRDHIPALTGLLSTLVCLILFGRDRFLIPAMLLITLVLTLLRGREESRLGRNPGPKRRAGYEISNSNRGNGCRDDPPQVPAVSCVQEKDAAIHHLSGEGASPGDHRYVGDLLPEGYFTPCEAVRSRMDFLN